MNVQRAGDDVVERRGEIVRRTVPDERDRVPEPDEYVVAIAQENREIGEGVEQRASSTCSSSSGFCFSVTTSNVSSGPLVSARSASIVTLRSFATDDRLATTPPERRGRCNYAAAARPGSAPPPRADTRLIAVSPERRLHFGVSLSAMASCSRRRAMREHDLQGRLCRPLAVANRGTGRKRGAKRWRSDSVTGSRVPYAV
jgi:hypothetical protein